MKLPVLEHATTHRRDFVAQFGLCRYSKNLQISESAAAEGNLKDVQRGSPAGMVRLCNGGERGLVAKVCAVCFACLDLT
jgi:hypothetical protein